MISGKTDDLVPLESCGCSIEEEVKKLYICTYGEKTLETAHILRCIELEVLRQKVSPHILYQLLRSFFDAVKSKDPLPFHHDLARRVLGIEYKNKKLDDSLVDLLAREICIIFNAFSDKLFPISWIEDTKDELNTSALVQGAPESVLNILDTDNPSVVEPLSPKGERFLLQGSLH